MNRHLSGTGIGPFYSFGPRHLPHIIFTGPQNRCRPGLGLTFQILIACLLSIGMVFGCQDTPPPPRAEPASELANGIKLDIVVAGLDQSVGMASIPNDASNLLYIVEKTGRIRIVEDGKIRSPVVLDLSKAVSSGFEQGLLGIAFHPRFAQNGRLFVNYTDTHGDTNVVEYHLPAGGEEIVDPKTARRWLFLDQPYDNHNGGHLAFGPDGKLYIGTGDGGLANDPHGHGQNKATMFGKILRFDVEAGEPDTPEILAVGLRNPWRYSFDRKTGDFYLGDVGQNAWEDINVVPAGELAGKNFGWNVVEGDGHCLILPGNCHRPKFTRPMVEYSTKNEGCSVIGGYVYRGKALPELQGHYFYSDWCSGLLRSFRLNKGTLVDRRDWKSALDPQNKLESIASFGEDADGELYLVSQNGVIFNFARRSHLETLKLPE